MEQWLVYVLVVWLFLAGALQIVMIKKLYRNERPFIPFWVHWDVLHILPKWVVFAVPPSHDHILFVRNRDIDGRYTPWHQVPLPTIAALIGWLWAPYHQSAKALEDYALALGVVIAKEIRDGGNLVLESTSYLGLATYVAGLPKSPLCVSRQFLIMKCRGDGKLTRDNITFISPEFTLAHVKDQM